MRSSFFVKTYILAQVLIYLPALIFAQADKNDWLWKEIGVKPDFQKLVPKKNIIIAVVDDAFDLTNPFLKSYYYQNLREIPGNNLDDDNNGKIDDSVGWDFSDNDNNVNPPPHAIQRFSHGTKVAGILAQTLQKLCQTGTSFQILPIKTSSDIRQSNYITDGYEGIKYALEQKADIIIACWSGGKFDVTQEAILKKAQAQGVVVVASAGNFYADTPVMPAAFPWAIAVAGIDKNRRKELVSNYGVFIDIVAPADSIATCYPYETDFNHYLSATSAATPVVGGIVASFMAAYPDLQAADFDRLLKNTAQPVDAYNSLYYGKLGAGLVNVYALNNYILTKQSSSSFVQSKAYLPLWQPATKEATFHVSPLGRFPSYKLLLSQPLPLKNTFAVSTFQNQQRKDTTLTAQQLSQPYVFTADSFQVHFLTRPFKGKNAFLYYEAQPIDSSALYCRDKVLVGGEEGYIEDGSGPENYANRCSCKWLIEVPKDKVIDINFEAFDTEAQFDQVYIFADDGTNYPILAIFSGPKIPPVITSWYNRVLVWFVTNNSNTHKGWRLHYKAVDVK